MSKDASVLAAINLHAILRAMEDLLSLDTESAALIASDEVGISFHVPKLEPLTLSFQQGVCTATRGAAKKSALKLCFLSPEHFNRMIAGEAIPVPVSGFRHIGFLKNKFTVLAARLTDYLRPDAERLQHDAAFKRTSTILTAYVAFFALAEIANRDKLGQACARHIKDGTILVNIGEVPLHITAEGGELRAAKGAAKPSAIMEFRNMEVANAILAGQADTYACIGRGELSIRGNIDMIDHLNNILALVPTYIR